ncbi:ABC-2 type transport system ATP-binding protein [Amycolatopsis arida]|uniref:ABC-2 type transport system ATP-binding protein n=1 Tax=Amycolatopsis arida TaxID=587909 RepID=A0A1I6AG78_9PSEU|nr:alpha/beta fold hydrolase [Amycolatopsis arida]TDX97705.1 ABC-2 type transport system ATP-binding protein [Amycolatopsis arida]SFQ67557.1 ABC-2 type transport system ATP-binding protein [Amycolatopsis arida]
MPFPAPSPRARRGRLVAVLAVAVLLAGGGLVWLVPETDPPPVRTEEAILEVPAAPGSAERIAIDTTLYVPQRSPAPAVLLPHGFGGDKNSVAGQARELAERGMVVLAYSARGFGRSGGRIALNDPDHEVADASRLLDHLSSRPEVLLDGAGDPRVAVTGASYGGALALLLAGTDRRVDAIAPAITYNDLGEALIPNAATTGEVAADTPAAGAFAPGGVFKRSWAGIFFSAGSGAPAGGPGGEALEPGVEPDDQDLGTDQGGAGQPGSAAPDGSASDGSASDGSASGGSVEGGAEPGRSGRSGGAAPARPRSAADPCGRFTAEVCRAYADVATDGVADERTRDLLRRVSPASVTGDITVPTLLVQGENDTLFGLDQADATARQVSAAGGEVDVVWYVGGHDGGSPGPQLRGRIADWLAHRLTGEAEHPGTSFRYEVQGSLRANGTPSVRAVDAAGYPGLHGGTTDFRTVALGGEQQLIVHPPGGSPAAVSGIPGLNRLVTSSNRLAGLFGFDPPGQSARFTSTPMDTQLLVTGAPRVRLRVAAEGPVPPSGAVLFAKLYDVNPDGTRTLPGSAVAAFRIPSLPTDGTPVEVTVTLPGIVRPVETGHALQLVVGTTDQSYATPPEAATYSVSLAGDAGLAVPVVPGTPASSGWPLPQLLGVAGVLAAVALVTGVAALRRRRAHEVDPGLADVPLVIESLTKSYPGGLTAVKDLSFRVEPGQVLGLLGPNGAGKTTTLRMLMGLITPSSGEIRVFGHKVAPGAPVLSRIGSFVEGAGFLPHLSGAANLRLYWAATGRPAEKAHIAEALEIAGLGDAVHRKVRTYSQGMRQRLAIAQAMLGLPELLVLDEPTNGLDPPQIHQMREVLRRYAATGRTVLVSSHLLAEVEQTSTHVVVMHRGALVAAGEVGDIVGAGGEATFRVDRPEAAAEALRAVGGVSEVDVDGTLVHADLDGLPRSAAVAALVRAGVSVEQAGPRRRLEDAFLQLVGEGGSGE